MDIFESALLCKTNFELGEGVFWHNQWQKFVFIDIKAKKIARVNTNGSGLEIKILPKMPGVVRSATDGRLVLAWQGEIVKLDFDTLDYQVLQTVEPEVPSNRSNDGACDANGRFWFGTMNVTAKLNAGNLYTYDGKLQQKMPKTSVSNGICWSQDNKTMYYIDSFDFNIKAYDFDLDTATLSNERIIVKIEEPDTCADGMCIDAEGMLWVAIWGGGCVNRYNPQNGELLAKVNVPAPHVTAVNFGGSNLQTLAITTARDGLTAEQLLQYPLSGSVFYIDTTTKGVLAGDFKF